MTLNVTSVLGNAAAATKKAQDNPASTATASFSSMVGNAISETVATQRAAEQVSIAAANGEDIPMHKVIESISRAELTLQTMVSVRDKAVEAYKEIMQMPI